uniref:Uncharacterized protein n=1 Tax=Leptobrachium leishanense TaxID=445787 RepID=A0A8C5WMP8_9ANUR
VTEGKEDCHLNTLKEAESILQEKMTSLEQINSQVLSQQQEIAKLDRLNGQKREELHLLRDHLDRTKADLKEVLREGELDVSEVKSLLEDLSVQKGDLNAQLSDRKAQLAILKQQVERAEDTLQKVATQIHKHKS